MVNTKSIYEQETFDGFIDELEESNSHITPYELGRLIAEFIVYKRNYKPNDWWKSNNFV